VTITSAGGYNSSHAVLTIAIAGGVGVAALCIGAAWSGNRKAVAGWLFLTILAGEAYGLLATSERLVAVREAAQAPLRMATAAHANALGRVKAAEATLEASPTTSPRLASAIAAKAMADTAAVQKSAERGCLENCRKLLQSQVDAAATEIAQARVELADGRRGAETELADARDALAAMKAPASPSALADRLNVSPWVVDLVAAALGSIAANGLACGLLVFGAHRRQPETSQEAQIILPAVAPAQALPAPVKAPRKAPKRIKEHAARFAVERLQPSDGDGTDLIAIHREYGHWCKESGLEALPGPQIGSALSQLFANAGISIDQRDGRLVAMGVGLKDRPLLAPPGPAA
jgi:hypothetical protein